VPPAFSLSICGMGGKPTYSAPGSNNWLLTELLHLNNKSIGPKSERKLWHEAMAALLRFHDAANDDFRRIKHEFEERIEQLLRRLAADSRISPDTPLAAMTGVLYAIASENFYRMIANEFRTVDEEKATMRGQVELVLQDWLNKQHPR